MGALLGVMLGIGLTLVMLAVTNSPWLAPNQHAKIAARKRRRFEQRRWLAEAGLEKTTPLAVNTLGLVLALIGSLTLQIITNTWPLALIAAPLFFACPWVWVSQRRQKMIRARAQAWPDLIDNVISGVRAGLTLTEVIIDVGRSAPAPMRPSFAIFEREIRRTGAFERALSLTRASFQDPVADRVCEALRIAHLVGGADVTTVLASLAQMLRADQRTRGELEARQSWTVNGARLAVAAPWIIVVLMCINPAAAAAYSQPAGVVILLIAAIISVIAYNLMILLARLPLDRRVFK